MVDDSIMKTVETENAGLKRAYTLTIKAKDIDARTVRVGRGKPGALFFFAGWCGSCLSEAKALDQVQRALGSRVTITAISPDPSDSPEAIRRFRQQVGNPRYSFVSDSAGV